jgi:hypothetical protein
MRSLAPAAAASRSAGFRMDDAAAAISCLHRCTQTRSRQFESQVLRITSQTGFAQYNYFGLPGNLGQPILQQLASQFPVGLQHSFAPDDYVFLLANFVGEV